MIYLDNAATTLKKPESVIDAVANAMRTMGNSSRGTHEASLGTSRTIFDTRIKLAEFFGADDPENVIFTCNSTEALNIAIRGTVHDGDHVITSVLEHNSVLRPLYLLESESKVSLSFLSSDEKGDIDPEEIRELVRPETKAIVVTHASNLTGNMTDIKRITEIAHEYGLLTIVDASQTAGSKKIDV
ncbi:MAG: aminotransferase class V-fold PLP-dependent enzyme, partial [Firmicutes bacterium]|nr:aminotransferase class V-fold PLP-dependent enzyme [Bacillota bacterium]